MIHFPITQKKVLPQLNPNETISKTSGSLYRNSSLRAFVEFCDDSGWISFLIARVVVAFPCKTCPIFVFSRSSFCKMVVYHFLHMSEKLYMYAPSYVGYSLALNESGSIYWQESVTPFGELETKSSLNDNQPSYHGHVRDEETGLYYMKARLYDPTIGQFISPDPVSFMTGGIKHLNRYVYVSNDPLTYYDPDGLAEILLQIKAYNVIANQGHLYIEYQNPNNSNEKYIFRGGPHTDKNIFNSTIQAQNTIEKKSKDSKSRLATDDKVSFLVSEITVDIGDAPNGFSKFLDDANLLASDITESETKYLGITDNSNTVANEFIIAVTGERLKISETEKIGDLTFPGRESDKLREGTENKDRFNTSTNRYNSFPRSW